MDKENVAYRYNGISFRLKKKKEIPVYAITWKNLKDIMLNAISCGWDERIGINSDYLYVSHPLSCAL